MIKNIVIKFSTAEELVMDIFARTFAIGKATLLCPQHRQFVGCEIEAERYKVSLKGLKETNSSTILNDKSDITVIDDVMDA